MELLMSDVPEDRRSTEAFEIESLVERTLAGDSGAFEQIVLRYERRVLTLAVRLLRTPDEAQDAAQEVFLRAFKYLHRLDVRRPLEPWLVRMTVNVCRDMLRKRQRRQATFLENTLPDDGPPDTAPDPHSGLAGAQQRKMLWKALDNLPEKERLAVILRDVDGHSTSEVAALLGSSEGTVRSQICRGRIRIKEALDQMMGDHA